MKLGNNKLANMFTALVICSSSVAPASATVDKDHWRGNVNEKSIPAILDEIGTGGWGVPTLPDTHDNPLSSPRRTPCQ
jgi:hypothetical protein